eukprot:4890026-Ditylum_brightwellii.AAC.1
MVEAAPPCHQRQNGLVERHWRTLVPMHWLEPQQYPTIYLFVTKDNSLHHLKSSTTRNMTYDNKVKCKTFQCQSLKCIVTGKDTKSTCLQFYHPPSKQFLSNTVNKLDPTLAAGSVFNLLYDGEIFFNQYNNTTDEHQPPGYDIGTK